MPHRVGRYVLGEQIGAGTFAKVRVAVNTQTHERVAIKCIPRSALHSTENVRREVAALRRINHPHLCNLHDVLVSRDTLYLVTELAAGGELFDRITKSRHFSENKSRAYFKQLVSAVAYCHMHGVCHRDIKPENIFLSADERTLKLGDFGLAGLVGGGLATSAPAAETTSFAGESVFHSRCGTPGYVAPEVLAGHGYAGEPADCWSCGVVLFVMLAGQSPWHGSSVEEILQSSKHPEAIQFPAYFSPGVRSLLCRILVADPQSRATTAEILEHPWTRQELLETNGVWSTSELETFREVEVVDDGSMAPPAVRNMTTGSPMMPNLPHVSAFDLISGAFNLSRITRSGPEVTSPHRPLCKRAFSHQSAPAVLRALVDSIESQKIVLGLTMRVEALSFKIIVEGSSGLRFTIQVYLLSSEPLLHMIEAKRTSGSADTFSLVSEALFAHCPALHQAEKSQPPSAK